MGKIDKQVKQEIDSLLASLEVIREGLMNSAHLISNSVKELQKTKNLLNNIIIDDKSKKVVGNIIDSNITSNLLNLNLFKETLGLLSILRELIENAIKFDDENNKGDEERGLKNRKKGKSKKGLKKTLE